MTRRTTVPVRYAAQERTHRPGRSSLALAAALLACLSAPLLLTSSAGASRVTTLREKAARILDQIDRNGEQISLLDEKINNAHLHLDQLHSQIRRTSLQIASAQHTVDLLHNVVATRAAALYRGAGGAISLGSQNAASVQQQGAMAVYSEAAASQDQQRIDRYRNARDDRKRAKAQLAKAEKDQSSQLKSLEHDQHQILAVNATEKRLYSQTKGALADAVAAEIARRKADAAAAAARARAAANAAAARSQRSTGSSGGLDTSTGIGPVGPVQAPSPGAGTAVSVAQSKLGDPYVYGAGGPNTFDCSGLTSFAWAAAGVYLPHSASAQYYSLPHVNIADVKPGDLVFFGRGYIHHVGMVVGGGTMIEAPHTGAVVRYASYYSRSDLVGAARP